MSASEPVIYAFGDSIVNGHKYPQQGSVERVVASIGRGWNVVKMARNGATICPSALQAVDLGGQILKQCDEVPLGAPSPDLIVFNGMTNDVSQGFVSRCLGTLTADDDYNDADFNKSTYGGCFEATIARFRRLWPDVPIIYLAAHKNGAISFVDQVAGHELAIAACAKWNVVVADVWADADFDTRRDSDRIAYSFDELGSDGLPGVPETIVYGHPESQPSGTHPNFPAIDKFYRQVLTKAMDVALRE